MRKSSLLAGLLALLSIGSFGCVQVYGPPTTAANAESGAATEDGASKSEKSEKTDENGKDGKEEDKEKKAFKPWDEVLKDTKAQDGFFKTHLKRDQTLYLELAADRLDQDFGMVLHYSRGAGVFNLQDGLVLSGTKLMRFRRVGDKVYLVDRNPLFTADPGSPMAASLADNVGHSIVAVFKIESEHEESKNVLIDVTPFFASDFADIARRLKGYFDDKPVGFDKERAFVSKIQTFPRNLELDAELTFTPSEPSEASDAGVSDWRSIPVGVRYSLFALPETPMQPRLADDRVGFFLHAVKDFSRDQEETTYVRYVRRWRLEKKDPSAELSEPVEPIVFWVDRSVPLEYRRYVAEGIEAWSSAFEAAGFENAVMAKIAPDEDEDATWSAEDIRYSTVRWTAAHSMGYAIGPSQMDPRTGELLNADILISSTFVTGWRYDWEELADPRTMVQRRLEAERRMRTMRPEERDFLCMAEMGMAHQLGVQHALLAGMGVIEGDGPLPEDFLGPAIRDLVLHEVGHTLGLRHNFKSSAGTPFEKLHDTSFTGTNGVTLSVMDYAPVNVSPDKDRQGHYWNPVPGSYDRWAIRYGYAPMVEGGEVITEPEDEKPHLEQIARLGADPLHTYGTDEDNWLGPWAVDPLTSAWDLGSDPVAFAEQRAELVSRVKPRLEDELIDEGDGYQRLRGAMARLTFEQWGALNTALRSVGGLYYARDHRGDPGQRPPFTPASADTQRRAVRLVTSTAFGEDAFGFSPEVLNKMAPNRWAHWGSNFFFTPVDFPVLEQVMFLQSVLLDNLLHPARLARVLNNEVRMPSGQEPYRLPELFGSLSESVWSEVLERSARDVSSMRRNLQRAHLDHLTALLLDPQVDDTQVPPDARALARWELSRLSERLDETVGGSSLDVYTKAHLAESQARIDRALEASLALVVR